MIRRAIGLALLNVAGLLVIAGSLYDLLVPSVPSNHLAYLGVAEGNNAYRMFRFGSPWYAPLGFTVLVAAGAVLASPPLNRRSRRA